MFGSFLKSVCAYFSLLSALVFSSVNIAVAQDNDFTLESFKRPSAERTPPFGITGSYSFTYLWKNESLDAGSLESATLDRNSRFGVTASYDTWFGGLRREFHGDVLRIGNRPAVEDMNSAIYFDIGLFSQETRFKNDYVSEEFPEEEIVKNERIPVMAAGYSYIWQKVKLGETVMQFTGDVLLGYASDSRDNNYFGTATFGLDIMKPFGQHLINYGVNTGFGASMANKKTTSYFTRGEDSGEVSIYSDEDHILPVLFQGITAYASFTFDINKY